MQKEETNMTGCGGKMKIYRKKQKCYNQEETKHVTAFNSGGKEDGEEE